MFSAKAENAPPARQSSAIRSESADGKFVKALSDSLRTIFHGWCFFLEISAHLFAVPLDMLRKMRYYNYA